MTDTRTLGERLVDEADQAIKDQYLQKAGRQLQNAANNISIAADHSTLGHDNRERRLWKVVQAMANLVKNGDLHLPQVASMIEDLQTFIINQERA